MVQLFAYYRVSTDKQTVKSQQLTVRNYIKSLPDTDIIEEFTDESVSGVINERDALQKMLARLDEVDGIVVYDETRLTRDLEYGIQLMFDFQKRGKKLYLASTKEIKSLSESTEQLIHMIKSWVASEERDKFRNRIRSGIARRQAEGKHFGRPFVKIKWKQFHILREAGLNKSACARILKIGVSTLFDKYSEHKKICEICQKLEEDKATQKEKEINANQIRVN